MLEVAAAWLELAELVSAWLLWLLVDEDVWALLLFLAVVDELDAVLDDDDELEHPANKNRAAPKVRVLVIILSIIGENTPTSTSGGILASLKHDSAFSFALWYI